MNEEKVDREKLVFSIHALRYERDFYIFDREIENLPGSSKPHMYDCVGVFEVETYWQEKDGESAGMWPQFLYDLVGHMGLVDLDEWILGSKAIMRGDFTDKNSGRTAPIKKLWMSAPEGEA